MYICNIYLYYVHNLQKQRLYENRNIVAKKRMNYEVK